MEKKGVAVFGNVTIDFDRMEIRRSGQVTPLTALEFRILRFFVDNPHTVFSREELLSAVWPERKRVNGRTVDNFVVHLRRKLEEDPAHPACLQTVYGVGYKFVPFPRTGKSLIRWSRGWTSDGRPEMRLTTVSNNKV
jgi:DNA-binding response OmpR family regulator